MHIYIYWHIYGYRYRYRYTECSPYTNMYIHSNPQKDAKAQGFLLGLLNHQQPLVFGLFNRLFGDFFKVEKNEQYGMFP